MTPGVSAGSNHVGAIDTVAAKVTCPAGVCAATGAASARVRASVTADVRRERRGMAIPPRSRLFVHRPVVHQPEPAARDPIDEPQPDDAERRPDDEEPEPERGHDEDPAEAHPQDPEPERADLPAEVRLDPRPAGVAPLRVVQDDGDDRGPPDEKGAHDGGGGDDP